MNDSRDLESLRQSIDRLDTALFVILSERFSVTQKVGEYKASRALPAVDLARETQQFEKAAALAAQYGLDPTFAQKMLRLIIDEVVVNHTALAATTKTIGNIDEA